MTVIATRRLTLRLEGVTQTVDVDLHAPEPERNAWICRFTIGWPEGSDAGEAGGFDSIQALFLAMHAIASRLYTSPHHQAGRLAWQKAGDGYGFPISRGGREELVGEDRAYYT